MTAVTISNDTGSDAQTIYPADLHALRAYWYHGPKSNIPVLVAGGQWVWKVRIEIEMQIVKLDGTPLTPWFREAALITPQTPSTSLLSGNAMRNHLYFATAPGNATLYVAAKKNGIVAQLPTV